MILYLLQIFERSHGKEEYESFMSGAVHISKGCGGSSNPKGGVPLVAEMSQHRYLAFLRVRYTATYDCDWKREVPRNPLNPPGSTTERKHILIYNVYRSSLSLQHTALFTREPTQPLRQYRVGCMVANVHKQVIPESCHHLTVSHAHSNPCLVSLLFIPSLYSTLPS